LAKIRNAFANIIFEADLVFDELNPTWNSIYLTFVGADSYPGWNDLFSNFTLIVAIEKVIVVIIIILYDILIVF
jgi:hypothetical protein